MKLSLWQVGISSAGVLLLLSSQLLPLAASSGQSKVIQMRDSNVLHQYLCGTYEQKVANNTVLKLILPSYVLNTSGLCLVSNKHNIGIVSNMEEPSVISCTTKSGLGFVNVSVLNITNVKIQSCGAAIFPLIDATTGPYLSNTSHVSLAIVDSSAVSLSTIIITRYYGYAILAVNVYGVSKLSDLAISKNSNSTFDGSGVMVYYHNSSKQASLSISNSQFALNQLLSSACLPELLSPLSNSTPIPTPYGSALSVVYNQVSQNVSVTLANSTISYNTGCPVVLILYYDSLSNMTMMIIEHTFIFSNQNTQCKCRGTGLSMVTCFSTYFSMKYKKSLMSNDWTSLCVSQTTIGYHLGAFDSETQSKSVVYLSTSQINGVLVHVVFQSVNFRFNSAAEVVYAETMSNNIKSLAVHFINVSVDGNIHNQVTKNYKYMPGGIVTFVQIAAAYLSDTNFTHNVGSAIEAYDTDVYMNEKVFFQYNSGSSGAALLLLGQSHLFLSLNLSAHFEYNAYKYGGAIYSFNNRVSDNNCTFQVLSGNLSMVAEQGPRLSFVDNIASIGHTSVSAMSIYECQQMQLDIKQNDTSNLYNTIFQFEEDYNNEMSSNPTRIVPCVKGEPQHNYSDLSYLTYPGRKFTISLAALDGSGISVDTPVQVRFYYGQNRRSLQPSSWWTLFEYYFSLKCWSIIRERKKCRVIVMAITVKLYSVNCKVDVGAHCTTIKLLLTFTIRKPPG